MKKYDSHVRASPERFRVAVLGEADFAEATAQLQGIAEFSDKRGNWEVLPLHYTQEHVITDLVRTESIHGLIGAFVSDRWIGTLVGSSGIPVVNTSNLSSVTVAPSVIPDDGKIGCLAARHLLRRQFTSFAFGGTRSSAFSNKREEGFAGELETAGFSVTTLPSTDISRPLHSWLETLRQLPKPTAVFCATDYIARRLILDATADGFAIPADISVVGVGDSALDSFFGGVGITSVVLATHAIGYRAAQMMHTLLTEGVLSGRRCLLIPPAGLVPRASTGMGPMHPLVARGLDLIESQLGGSQLTVASLVRQLHASRRLVELRFRETLGHSPHAEITQQRMSLARRLLLDPRVRIADITTRCGYTELSHFYHRFKVAHGATPAAWRAKALAH